MDKVVNVLGSNGVGLVYPYISYNIKSQDVTLDQYIVHVSWASFRSIGANKIESLLQEANVVVDDIKRVPIGKPVGSSYEVWFFIHGI